MIKSSLVNGCVRITEEEMVKLMQHFLGGKIIEYHFGPGWVGLPYDEYNPSEAIQYVVFVLRGAGIENCAGAGI